MRLLVDIAERSLSESPFQDPTTAVQAIDRLHDILRQLARRPFSDGRVRDERGEIRLLVKTMTWENYVHLGIGVLDEQAVLLHAATRDALQDEQDARFALDPDREGLGAAAP
jgi:uncharacterized membrane protein